MMFYKMIDDEDEDEDRGKDVHLKDLKDQINDVPKDVTYTKFLVTFSMHLKIWVHSCAMLSHTSG